MMEILFPEKPFFKRLEFMGRLSKRGQTANKIHLVLQYPMIKQGKIIGEALGTKTTLDRIEEVASVPEPFWTLDSEESGRFRTEVHSDRVLLSTGKRQVWPSEFDEELTSRVSSLRLLDLTVTTHLTPSDTQGGDLTFFLAGPRELWLVDHIRELSYTGEAKIKARSAKIELDEDLPFEIDVLPYYFHDEGPEPDGHELTANVLTLHFKAAKPRLDFSEEAFLESAKTLASDLCTLVSFASRSWVTWYRYVLVTEGRITEHFRETRKCPVQQLGWRESLLEPQAVRGFLRTALTKYHGLRDKGFNLFTPILYFVSANEKNYLEEQFTTLFLALEKITDMFAREHGLLRNLEKTAFEKLRTTISDVLKSEVSDPEVLRRISNKIPELNRPPFRFVLENLLSAYNTDWKDLYPASQPLTIIKTRGELFHSSREVDLGQLAKDRQRLQIILERLLLRLLGWSDLSRSPRPDTREWLARADENNNDI